jgi:hypothetical protein
MILPILFLASQFAAIILLLAILESSRQRSRHEKILKNLGRINPNGVGSVKAGVGAVQDFKK